MSDCCRLITKLEECIRRRKLNTSSIREEVLHILCKEDRCLDSDEIYTLINAHYPKKVSQNTVYRILHLLESCKLIVSIPTLQKRQKYYICKEEEFMSFRICTNCGEIIKFKLSKELDSDLEQEGENSLLLLHYRCPKCRQAN